MRTGHGPKVKVRMSELSKVIYGQKSVEELTGTLCIFLSVIRFHSVISFLVRSRYCYTVASVVVVVVVVCNVMYCG